MNIVLCQPAQVEQHRHGSSGEGASQWEKGEKYIPKYSTKTGLWLHEQEDGTSLGSLSDAQE